MSDENEDTKRQALQMIIDLIELGVLPQEEVDELRKILEEVAV